MRCDWLTTETINLTPSPCVTLLHHAKFYIPYYIFSSPSLCCRGTSGIDIDLRRVDIDQCPLPKGSTQLNIFAASDKCKKRTTEVRSPSLYIVLAAPIYATTSFTHTLPQLTTHNQFGAVCHCIRAGLSSVTYIECANLTNCRGGGPLAWFTRRPPTIDFRRNIVLFRSH